MRGDQWTAAVKQLFFFLFFSQPADNRRGIGQKKKIKKNF